MLELERLATNLFETGNDLEWVQRGGAAKFDSPALCCGMPQSKNAHFGDVQERDPTHGAGPGSIDASRSIQVIEPECRAQPYFHEPTSPDRSKVQVPDRMLDMRFCVCQREGDTGGRAKGD